MTIDTQEQKDLLIRLIATASIGGNMEQAKELLIIMSGLLKTVENAHVTKKAAPKKPNNTNGEGDKKALQKRKA